MLQKNQTKLQLINQLKKMQKEECQPSKEHTQQFGDDIRSIGSWSFNQNLLYVIFLQKNKLVMISKKKRRNLRIFDQMAEFISTRNSLQCRSHHQKLLQKFGEVKSIISNFKKYITKEQYKNKFQELFGKDQSKKQAENKWNSVKQQVLSQQLQPLSAKEQQKFPIVVEPKIQEYQELYNQYLLQLNRQLLQYPLLSYFYQGLQNFS